MLKSCQAINRVNVELKSQRFRDLFGLHHQGRFGNSDTGKRPNRFRRTHLPTYLPTYLSMDLQSFVGPWPLFQFLNPIHSR
jgi:hypothetical protein